MMLSSHLIFGLTHRRFPSRFPIRILYASSHLPSVQHALPTAIYVTSAFLLYQHSDRDYEALHYVIFSIHLFFSFGPNIFLSTIFWFSNTHNCFSSLEVSDHVPHPYTTTGRIMVLYILSLKPPRWYSG